MDKTTLLTQIDALITEYQGMRARSAHDDLSDLPEDSNKLVVRLKAAIARMTLPSSTYAKEAAAVDSKPVHVRIPTLVGIVQALRADIDAGWLEGVAELLHADTLSDFLDQAEELASKQYKDAAAVVSGSAPEAHLRLLCMKFGVSTQIASGAPKKADGMNAELVKTGAYNTIQQKSITAWLGIRNSAAHGNYGDYDASAVKSMITSVRDFIGAHPA